MIFEHPLNESIRAYLRIEHLIRQMNRAYDDASELACLGFFRALFELQELLERGDYRQDLLKDLEKHESDLARWAEAPGVDLSALNQFRSELQRLIQNLRAAPRLGTELKEDRFLAGIRQRFTIPGGNCCFDLPQLHLWLHQSPALHKDDQAAWLNVISPLTSAVVMHLQLCRERGAFSQETAKAGFFQDSAEGLQLLRVRMSEGIHLYPTISGNRHRFTVRFHQPSEEGSIAFEDDVPFEVARC